MQLQGHCGEDFFRKVNTYIFEMGLKKIGRCVYLPKTNIVEHMF